MIKGTGQRLIPRKLLEWIKGLHKGEGSGLNISTLTDSNGNPRFVEGEGILDSALPEGVTISYCKWSLSGTHLMLVIAGTVADTTAFSNVNVCTFNIPKFALDKIYPVFLSKIEYKDFRAYASDYSNQQITFSLAKQTNNLVVRKEGATTFTAERGFRCQFDLLIDTE